MDDYESLSHDFQQSSNRQLGFPEFVGDVEDSIFYDTTSHSFCTFLLELRIEI